MAEKSSISLLRITPVPAGMKPLPNGRLILSVAATRLPAPSSTEKWVVWKPSPVATGSPSSLLGVALSSFMEAARCSA